MRKRSIPWSDPLAVNSGYEHGKDAELKIALEVLPEIATPNIEGLKLERLTVEASADTIDEAVLGGKIEVPTVTGRVQLTIPKGTSSGRVFRLKGKGVRNMTTGTNGDQLVTMKIVLPEKVDDELSYFFSEWKQKHSYNPGRD